MEQLWIPAGEGNSEYIEKKSRFLGLVLPVTTEAEARAQLEAVKKREYDARHNCWAYVLHTGQKRYSDDGEPQGTAGQPILNVLEREGVQDVLCVVTRYFGGILLGAGGLCRAYTKAAKDALDDAGISELRPWSVLRLDCPYALFERVKLEAGPGRGLRRADRADDPSAAAGGSRVPEGPAGAFRREPRAGNDRHGAARRAHPVNARSQLFKKFTQTPHGIQNFRLF